MATMEMGFSRMTGYLAEGPLARRLSSAALGFMLIGTGCGIAESDQSATPPLPSTSSSPSAEAAPAQPTAPAASALRFPGNPAGSEWRTSADLVGLGENPGTKYDQELLIAVGCSAGVADAIIEGANSYTIRAIKRAQAALGVEADGRMGPITRDPAEDKANANQPVCDSPEPKIVQQAVNAPVEAGTTAVAPEGVDCSGLEGPLAIMAGCPEKPPVEEPERTAIDDLMEDLVR